MKDKLMGSLITIAIIIVASAAIWFAFFRPKAYDAAVVKKSDLQEVVSDTGTVISNRTKTYYTASEGEITSLSLKTGDTVKKNKSLYSISASDSSVKAGFTGIVTELGAAKGAIVPAGTPILTLADPNDLSVSMEIPQEDVDKLSLSQKAEVTIGDYHYSAKVNRIAKMAAPSSGKPKITVEVSINKPDKHIYLGAEIDVEIYTASKESAIVIPIEAVYSDADNDFVYVIEDGKVLRKTITIGASSKSLTEVTGGLVSGDVVITGTITDGERGNRAAAK